MKRATLSVIGLGKLGLATAACLARKGFEVIGVDINQQVVEAINEGRSPFYEPGLDDLMKQVKGKFTATTDYKHAVDKSQVVFIFVGTPSEDGGSFSTKYVEEVTREIAVNLKHRDDYPVIVLRSTVLPGVTDEVVRPMLEKISGLKCGMDFGLCHNPEVLALGSVIRDFLNPDMIIIGESDEKSGEILSEVYRQVCENIPPIIHTSLSNAEMAKVSLNVFLTIKMSYANTLAEICEVIPGGDVDVVSDILGKDKRIGRKFLTGAIGWGGPCFPRDTKAFFNFAEKIGCQAKLARAADEVNDLQCVRVVSQIRKRVGDINGKTIAILGLTYKPNTDIVLESDAIKIALALLQAGAKLRVYDPAGMENVRRDMGDENMKYTSSALECIKDADLAIIATPWDEFKCLTLDDFTRNMKQPVLLDCWRLLRQLEYTDKLNFIAVGLGNQNV